MQNPKDIYNKAMNLLDCNRVENSHADYYNNITHLEKINFKFDKKLDISIYHQIIQLLNEFVVFITNCKITHIYLGNVNHQIKDFENASLNYKKAIALDENYDLAYYNLGALNLKLKNNQEAIDNFTHAISINPNFKNNYFNRGNAHFNLNNRKEALQDFTEYISREPKYYKAYLYRAIIYKFEKEFKKTIEDCTKAISLNPNHIYLYKLRGQCYLECDEYKNAIADLEKTIELGASDKDVLKLLHEAQMKLNDSSKPNKKLQIIQAICDMNISALEELLDDFRTYQDATKETFLTKLKEAFDFFKDKKETSLIPFAGYCNFQNCKFNPFCRGIECSSSYGLKGLSFAGKVSRYKVDLIFTELDNNFKDVFYCRSFKIEDKNVNTYLDYRIEIKLDEKANLILSGDKLEMVNKWNSAYNEIVNHSIDVLSKETIINWLNVHAKLFFYHRILSCKL